MCMSASQSKNAVSTNLKHSRYIHLMSNFLSIHSHTKRLYVHMFDIVDTAFNYCRALIVMLITSGIFKDIRKYSVCDLICRYCVLIFWGRCPLASVKLIYKILQNLQDLGLFKNRFILSH